MNPYYDVSGVQIYHGDVLEVLRTLPDGIVQTVVTSPPYWGLRDYGTAKWEGGETSCDHNAQELRRGVNLANSVVSTRGGAKKIAEVGHIQYRGVCGKCGAVRVDQQLGLEQTPDEFVAKMVEVFREVRRVLRDDGTLWLNLGDCYAQSGCGEKRQLPHGDGRAFDGYLREGRVPGPKGTAQPAKRRVTQPGPKMKGTVQHQSLRADEAGRQTPELKPKDLVGIPWRVAFALQADGWYLRSDIIWAKPNPMPESVTDRPTKAHEYIFLLTKSERYFYDAEAIKEPAVGEERDQIAARMMRVSDDHKSVPNAEHNGIRRRPSVPRGGFNGKTNQLPGREAFRAVTEMRSKRTVWNISTEPFPEAHFATFPTEIPRLCIEAGTSAYGACANCGTPWKRIVKASGGSIGKSWNDHDGDMEKGQRVSTDGKGGNGYKRETVGWDAGCECGGGYSRVAGVVLDPFHGAGTTAMVAKDRGRRYIGVELNEAYIKMSTKRLVQDVLPLAG